MPPTSQLAVEYSSYFPLKSRLFWNAFQKFKV
uniref:Uncharacterized protein n=1 Tax=Anguilla anguilla TaxID=7936 RepID=A0A0E9VXK9_ANGAN